MKQHPRVPPLHHFSPFSTDNIMYWSLWLCVVSLFIASITHWVYKWRNPKCNGKLPPGSMGLPLIGETIQFFIPSKSSDISDFIKKRMKKYGPVFRTSLAGRGVVVSADAEFNSFIFQQLGTLVEVWYLDSFAKLRDEDESSVFAKHQVHRYVRNLVSAYFGIETLKENLLSKSEEMIRTRLEDWAKLLDLELKASTSKMMFDCTAKQLFSHNFETLEANVKEKLISSLQDFQSIPINIPGTAFHKCLKSQKEVMKMISSILSQRKASAESGKRDFLDEVIEDMKKEKFLTDDVVVMVIFGVLLTSSESTSSNLTMAMKLLTENPSVLQELTEEHEEIIKNRKDPNSGISWQEYKSMTFTRYVINESLRLASATPAILRKALKDIQVNEYTIPAGWGIMMVPATFQLDPKAYDDPLAFNPWRWKDIGASVTNKNFIAFGKGSRLCVGAEFSRVLMAVFFHILVTNYRWTKIKGGEVVRSPALTFPNGLHIKISSKKQD